MGIIGDKQHVNFHLHLHGFHFHHHENKELKDVPKGNLAILVGQGEEQQRFLIPLMYVTHPLFTQLLKEAEEEYEFDHEGPITIPCHVQEFRNVQGMINKDNHHHHHQCLRARELLQHIIVHVTRQTIAANLHTVDIYRFS